MLMTRRSLYLRTDERAVVADAINHASMSAHHTSCPVARRRSMTCECHVGKAQNALSVLARHGWKMAPGTGARYLGGIA